MAQTRQLSPTSQEDAWRRRRSAASNVMISNPLYVSNINMIRSEQWYVRQHQRLAGSEDHSPIHAPKSQPAGTFASPDRPFPHDHAFDPNHPDFNQSFHQAHTSSTRMTPAMDYDTRTTAVDSGASQRTRLCRLSASGEELPVPTRSNVLPAFQSHPERARSLPPETSQ